MSDYDLTTLDRPLGEYPDEVIGALVRAWQSGAALQYRIGDGDNWGVPNYPSFSMLYSYRLAPEPRRPMSPPWDVLPEWAAVVASNKNGDVCMYEAMPESDATIWFNIGGRCECITYLRFDRGNMPWDHSLVLRPEGV